jgi:hypothetical protein
MVIAGILCLVADAWALDSAVATGFATAVRANPTEASVLESAPATMALSDRYAVSLTGGIASSDELGFRLQGMDSKTGAFALGISYVHDSTDYDTPGEDLPGWRTPTEDPSTDPTRHTNFAVGGALGWADDRIAAGATVRRYSTKATYASDETAWNVGLGVGSKLGDQVTLSLTGMNLVPNDATPFTMALAGRVAPSELASLEVDLVSDFTSEPDQPVFGAAVGGEIFVHDVVPIRAGFAHDAASNGNSIGFGLGAVGPGAAAQYGFHAAVGDGPFQVWGTGTWHTLELVVSL